MAQVLLGSEVANALTEKLAEKAAGLREKGLVPQIAIVRVGAREDDLAYERGAVSRMGKVGIDVKHVLLPEDVTQEELEATFAETNNDPAVHGILLFQPLPKHLDATPLKKMIDPRKDLDGMCDANSAKVFSGDTSGFAPCTPSAVMAMLDYYVGNLSGKRITVVGRSMVVGRPLAMLLLKANATVTICHTRTKDLAARTSEAEILVAAAGKARMITEDMVGEGAVVIDVGINVDDEGNLCGDVDFDACEKKASAISPVPRGVGSVTTSVLADHLLKACEMLND